MVATMYLGPGYRSSVILLNSFPKTLLVASTPGLQPPETQGLSPPFPAFARPYCRLPLFSQSPCDHIICRTQRKIVCISGQTYS